MSSNKVSSIVTITMLLTFSLFADPLWLADWNWTDASGALHEYGVFDFPNRSWDLSRNQVDDGWYLATITSAGEQAALVAGLRGIEGEYWLGGYQVNRGTDPADNWAWIIDEEWNYRNWAPGEPNDAYGSNSEQHLAAWSLWGTSEWLWNDEGYLPNINGYIAERIQSVPEPATVSLCAIGLLALFSTGRKKRDARSWVASRTWKTKVRQ